MHVHLHAVTKKSIYAHKQGVFELQKVSDKSPQKGFTFPLYYMKVDMKTFHFVIESKVEKSEST